MHLVSDNRDVRAVGEREPGPNYLQLPINSPKTHVATNQRDGQMAYHGDPPGAPR